MNRQNAGFCPSSHNSVSKGDLSGFYLCIAIYVPNSVNEIRSGEVSVERPEPHLPKFLLA